MKTLSTKEQIVDFAEENKEFLDFLYMEGIWEGKKGYVDVMVNEDLEIISGGFEKRNRKGMKFTGSDKKGGNKIAAERKINGYYRVYSSESLEDLCYIRRSIICRN